MARPKKAELSKDAIDLILADLNRTMKGAGRIDRGNQVAWLDRPRLRSGILGLDVATRGGLPRGSLVQFWGPYSSAKTTSAIHAMKAEQRRGKHVAFAAGEGFAKDWARKNGLWIPFAAEEYESASKEQRTAMEAYDAEGMDAGWGSVTVAQHMHGDGLLEVVARLTGKNVFSLIVVDSLAILKPARLLEEMEIGDEMVGGGGQTQMFGRFVAKVMSVLNNRYNADGEIDLNGTIPNDTTVLCLNQARIKMGARGRPGQVMYQPVGGEALKHSWTLSVEFSKGETLGEFDSFDGGQRWHQWGQEVKIKIEKSKVGPGGRFASWDLYTDNHGTFKAGEIDHGKQLRVWGTYYEIIAQQGAWFTLPDGQRCQGKDAVEKLLREDTELANEIAEMVLDRCRR